MRFQYIKIGSYRMVLKDGLLYADLQAVVDEKPIPRITWDRTFLPRECPTLCTIESPADLNEPGLFTIGFGGVLYELKTDSYLTSTILLDEITILDFVNEPNRGLQQEVLNVNVRIPEDRHLKLMTKWLAHNPDVTSGDIAYMVVLRYFADGQYIEFPFIKLKDKDNIRTDATYVYDLISDEDE